VDDGTPFLPFETVINSNNWLERRGYTDDPSVAGEVVGATRPWFRGNRPQGPFLVGPCGTPDDFLGNGTPGVGASNLDMLPPCCTTINDIVGQWTRRVLIGDLIFDSVDYGGTSVSGLLSGTASQYMLEALSDFISFGFITPQLDLWNTVYSSTPDSLSDFLLLTDPSLTAGNLGILGPTFPDPIYGAWDANYSPCNFLGSDIVGGLGAQANGWVISDGFGNVISYGSFTSIGIIAVLFYFPTDSLIIQMEEQVFYDFV
jgi:hypothetical protein